MSDIWIAGDLVRDLVEKAVANWHPDLALCNFAIVLREKASKSGGVEIPGKTRKASKMLQVLGREPYDYVLEIAGDMWNEFDMAQRLALLDHLLCHCHVEFDESSDEAKYQIRKPNIQMFSEEVVRHGYWTPAQEGSDNDTEVAVTNALEIAAASFAEVQVSNPEETPDLVADEDVSDLLA